MLTFAIGDLHGRLDLLLEAYGLAREYAGERPYKFVVCGDFVDRGPDSMSIIENLMLAQRGAADNERLDVIVLKGNHEDMMLQCLRDIKHINWWLGNGGIATLRSYGYRELGEVYDAHNGGGIIPAAHMAWLDALPVHHIDEHRAFVHAGFDPTKPLDEQNEQHMMWRYDGEDREDQPNYTFDGRHVVHGHVQHADGPILLEHTTNLDTFAWYTGRLAVGVFEARGRSAPRSRGRRAPTRFTHHTQSHHTHEQSNEIGDKT